MSLVYGKGPVLEALRAGRRRVHRIWLAEGTGRDLRVEELRSLAGLAAVRIEAASRTEIERRAESRSHQGVLAEVEPLPRRSLESLLEARPGLLVFLDGVQDPQNLGAILRTAECAGAAAVVVAKDRAAPLTPAAVKVAEGAAEHVPVVEVTNLSRALREGKDAGLWTVGFEADGARPWSEARLEGPTALVFGSEGEGMRRLVRETCDDLASIPVLGRVGSLNVATAVAVALFEALRQQRVTRPGPAGDPGRGPAAGPDRKKGGSLAS